MIRFRKWHCILAAAAVSISAVSCKDDEENEVLPSLSGNVKFDLTEFIYPNTALTMTPKNGCITHPENEGIGWCWRVSPGMTVADTTLKIGATGDGSFKYFFGDSLVTYSVTCSAFAKGYSPSSSTRYVSAVKGGIIGGSISGVTKEEGDFWFTDSRDNRQYLACHLDGHDWMKENLAYKGAGVGFRGSDVAGDVFGRFYSWEEALTVCPEGWHLPSDAEWMAVASKYSSKALSSFETWPGVTGNFMANAYFNGIVMWEYWPKVKITNTTGLSVIPVGYCNLGDKVFTGLYENASFWTSDINPAESSEAICRYMTCDVPDFYAGTVDKKDFGASVRCVR